MIRRQLSASVSEGGAYLGSYSMDLVGWSYIFAIFKGIKAKYGVVQSMNRGPLLLGPEEAVAEGFITSTEEFKPTLESSRGPSNTCIGSTQFTEVHYFGPTEGHTPTEWLGHITLTGGAQWAKLRPFLPNVCELTIWPAELLPSSEADSSELLEKLLTDLAREAAVA